MLWLDKCIYFLLWIKVICEKAVMTLCKTSGHCYLVYVNCIAYDVVCVACNKFYQVRWFNICLMVNQCHHYWFDVQMELYFGLSPPPYPWHFSVKSLNRWGLKQWENHTWFNILLFNDQHCWMLTQSAQASRASLKILLSSILFSFCSLLSDICLSIFLNRAS